MLPGAVKELKCQPVQSSFAVSVISPPPTQRHIRKDFNPQHNRCGSLSPHSRSSVGKTQSCRCQEFCYQWEPYCLSRGMVLFFLAYLEENSEIRQNPTPWASRRSITLKEHWKAQSWSLSPPSRRSRLLKTVPSTSFLPFQIQRHALSLSKPNGFFTYRQV